MWQRTIGSPGNLPLQDPKPTHLTENTPTSTNFVGQHGTNVDKLGSHHKEAQWATNNQLQNDES